MRLIDNNIHFSHSDNVSARTLDMLMQIPGTICIDYANPDAAALAMMASSLGKKVEIVFLNPPAQLNGMRDLVYYYYYTKLTHGPIKPLSDTSIEEPVGDCCEEKSNCAVCKFNRLCTSVFANYKPVVINYDCKKLMAEIIEGMKFRNNLSASYPQ